MSTSKKPDKAGPARERGRPSKHRLAFTEAQALDALDRMLGKKPAPRDQLPDADAPRVPSKRPKK
jgi:hypothetical protein